jgi:hypothetical protein
MPSLAAAASPVTCPGPVDHVLVEQGHHEPDPILIPPDVGAYEETPQQEWTYLNRTPGLPPVTVHCFQAKDGATKTDLVLSADIKKCILKSAKFSCE